MTTFAPSRKRVFVPTDFDPADWAQLEPQLQSLLDRELDSGDAVNQWLKDASELTAVVGEAGARRSINHACHTDDPAIEKAYFHWVENIAPKMAPFYFKLKLKLLESPYVDALDPQTYGVMLKGWRTDADLFREENIPLDVEVTKLNAEYDKLIGAMQVEYDGKTQTLQQLARYQEEPDREVREATWKLSANRRLEDREKVDAIYDKMIALRKKIAANADCADFREYVFKDMNRFDYTPADCERFGDAVEQLVKPLRAKLLDDRREKMKLAVLRPWDAAVDPLGRPALRPFDKDDVTDLVTKSREVFKRVSPQLETMFAKLEMGRNLDLESRMGKRAGGFQSSLSESGEPFIFMNAAGLQRDVETLLHEGGHAFHYLWAYESQPVVFLHHAPLEFCEVASMSMELLGMDHFNVFYNDQDAAARAKERLLSDVVHTLSWIAVIDGFQHWIYTHPDHTREQRTAAWREILSRFQGDSVDYTGFEDVRDSLWQRQLHLFHVPFYYIEYGIAQLGALQLWQNYRKDPKQALEQYRQALSLGNSRPLPELFAAAGIRFDFTAETIAPLMQAVEAEV